MPVFNGGDFLSIAIESILNQSLGDFEFIIVDDGSSDNSINDIKNFCSDYRIKFHKRKHLGITKQLNFAIDQAEGIYLARMDADDISDPFRLEIQLDYLKSHPDVSIVGSNIIHIDKFGKKIRRVNYPESHSEIEFQMPVFSSFCHPAILTYTSIFRELHGYNENYDGAEDHILFLKMLDKKYKMYNIQKPLLQYRIHTTPVKSTLNQKQNLLSKNAGHEYLNNLNNLFKEPKDNFSIQYRHGLIEYYRGDMSVARKYFFQAIKAYPSKCFSLIRYVIVSFFGTNIINKLREKMILYNLNLIIHRIIGIDLNKIKK